MAADLDDLASMVNRLISDLRVHDERTKFAAENMAATQERIGLAVEKIADATLAIRTLTDHLETREEAGSRSHDNGTNGFKLTPQIAAWLLGGGVALGAALKGGAEVAAVVAKLFGLK